MNRNTFVAALAALALLAACAPLPTPGAPGGEAPAPLPLETTAPTASAEPGAIDTPSEEPVPQTSRPTRPDAFAVADLAQRLSIPVEEVTVVEMREVTWPDAGIGCPQPGMNYAQVLTEGVLIRLEAGGQSYDYHGAAGRDPFLCDRAAQAGSKPAPKVTEIVLPSDQASD